MEVRILQKSELLPALHLVWEVFVEDVAPSYTDRKSTRLNSSHIH